MRQQYSSYDECVEFFKQAQKTNPDLFKVEFIGTTWEDREIIAVSITKNIDKHLQKPALFYTGTIHAREWIGIELSLSFAKYILEHIDYDPQLNAILDRSTLYMVPCANPDGFEYSRNHFSFWRKNRRKNADGSFGVDLNRNFSVGFTPNKDTTSNVYSGPNAFSEPETAALRDFFTSHKNITIALDYHSQGNVFFPAHNFIHEDAIDAIDLNLLAGNMAEEIRKESGREYGVHMGKPPVSLISGSGREFYYSQGALSLVAEVGTRNISDYLEHMSEHIDENLPALIYALSEVNNYKKENSLPRVENLISTNVGSKEVELCWDYIEDKTVYFEIYRSSKKKGFAQSSNRIGITKLKTYTDKNLTQSTNYYYYVRAVCKEKFIKSPYAQMLAVRTHPAENMFSKILYPLADKIGYVGEKTKKNASHFGNNSMFVGISEGKGECFGVCGFSLSSIPKNAIITSASISFYPMNRVSVQVENFGEWRIGQMDERTIENIASFDDIKNAKILSYIDRPTGSAQLAQGIWRTYKFATQELNVLQKSLIRSEALFRLEGPSLLPLDRASQLMQWDIGYGHFSGGLTYRPKLDISYTIDEVKIELRSSYEFTATETKILDDKLVAGFDKDGFKKYACAEFDLSQWPDMDNTVVSSAYIEIDAIDINSTNTLRFHIELIMPCDGEKTYEKIQKRKIIERIGYDISVSDIKVKSKQRFVFDRYAINEMIENIGRNSKAVFVISASSHKLFSKNQEVEFMDEKRLKRPSLIINYIKKRRNAPQKVENLRYSIENDIVKLEWDIPDDDGYKGAIVVKNPFRIPCSAYDGQKLYGGMDNYTYDNFGDTNMYKHYAVFSYDDVPNFSEPASIELNPEESK
ncbi:MAG: M14 family metallopeptidase [Sulfurimonas sp.]|uniref:M14 family metallopeptidase n=1 Tax=Sulfurimonas sp. TaxID=2022749 RepID=UPI00261DF240|nr:M14 family metallopeptidase [Sulfurimonas sp.]MCW8894810.1 M14 family metallopeptidase [Sulfurimonas sp.]MCW8953753.1 M14 family metallopeptidase [Sulfurimonas sp.]MCW9068073.1 M14 family metallopeptidase [Sulfurimonas sp.]